MPENEKLGLLYNAMKEDEVFSQIVPNDVQTFVKEYSDPKTLRTLYDALSNDEVFSQVVPDSFEAAVQEYGLGKPSAVPSVSSDGGSAMKPMGVELSGTLPTTLKAEDVQAKVEQVVPAGELANIDYAQVAQKMQGKTPMQAMLEQANTITDDKEKANSINSIYNGVVDEYTLKNNELETKISDLRNGYSQVSSDFDNNKQQYDDLLLKGDEEGAALIYPVLKEMEDNINWMSEQEKQLVDEYNNNQGNIDRYSKLLQSNKESKDGGLMNELAESFLRGSSRLGESLANTPAFVYDIFAIPQNAIADKYDLPWLKVSSEKTAELMGMPENKVAQFYNGLVKQSQDKFQEKYDKGITEYIKDGSYSKALGLLANQVSESAPVTISLMMGNAAGVETAASIAGGGTVFGAQKKKELDRDAPWMSEQEKINAALMYGFAEGVFEQFGLTKIGAIVKNTLLKSGKEIAADIAKKSFIEVYGKVLRQYLGTMAEEGLSEAATQYSQNAIDKYSGAKPNLDLMEGVLDAFIVGFGSGATYGTVPTSLRISQSKKAREKIQRIEMQRKELTAAIGSESITDAAKGAVSEKLKQLNEEQANIEIASNNIIETLPESSKNKLNSIQGEIDEITQSLESSELSPEVKNILEEKVNQLNNDKDAILSETTDEEPSIEQQLEEIKNGDVKLEKGNKIQWNVYGNEESGEWTISETTKTRGGKDAVVLTKVYVEDSSDGNRYTKEYADANGIKYDNEFTVEHVVPLEDLQSIKETPQADRGNEGQAGQESPELRPQEQTQASEEVTTNGQTVTPNSLESELENPDISIDDYINANPALTDYGRKRAREDNDNETNGKSQARGVFKYKRGEITARELLMSDKYGYNYNPPQTDADLKEYADGEFKKYESVYNKILEKYEGEKSPNQKSITPLNQKLDTDNKTKQAKISISKRLKGDKLLDAEDLIDELSENKAEINNDGTVILYHRTTKENAEKINKSGEIFGLEDGVFLSTTEKGQAEGYGDVVIKLVVPVDKIEIDDTFGDEAHVRIPTKRANEKVSIKAYSPVVINETKQPIRNLELTQTTNTQQQQPTSEVSPSSIDKGEIGIDVLKDVESTAKALEGVNIPKKFSPNDKVILKTKEGNEVEVSFRGYNGENKAVVFGDRGSGVGQVQVDINQLRAKTKNDKLSQKERNELISKIDINNTKYKGKGFENASDKEIIELSINSPLSSKITSKESSDRQDYFIAIKPLNVYLRQEYGGDEVSLNNRLTNERQEAIDRVIKNPNYSQQISEAYHKAKSDGSNPELVKAVENLLTTNKQEDATKEGKIEQGRESEYQGTDGQQQGGQENRVNQEGDVAQAEVETGGGNIAEQSGAVQEEVNPFTELAKLSESLQAEVEKEVNNEAQDIIKEDSDGLPSKEELTDSQKVARENLAKMIVDFNKAFGESFSKNIGVVFDPKVEAQKMYNLHVALVNVMRAAIQSGVADIQAFAALIGKTRIDKFTERAWKDAELLESGQPAIINNADEMMNAAYQKVANAYNEQYEDVKKARKSFLTRFVEKFNTMLFESDYFAMKTLKGLGASQARIDKKLTTSASGRAKVIFDDYAKRIFGGLNSKELTLLNNIIQARTIISIDERFDAKGEKRPLHPKDMTMEDQKIYLGQLAESNPKLYEKLSDRADAYFAANRQLLRERLDEGRISIQQYNAMVNNEYSPRVFLEFLIEENQPKSSSAFSYNDLADIKSLDEGSVNSLFHDAIWLLSTNVMATNAIIFRNRANRSLYEFIKSNPNNSGGLSIQNPIGVNKNGEPEYAKAPNGFSQIQFKEDGVLKSMIAPTEFVNSWGLITPLMSPAFSNAIRAWSGGTILRTFATAINPLFAISNFPRDVSHALFFTNTYNPTFPIALVEISNDLLKTARAAFMLDAKNKDGDFYKFLEEGGGTNYLTSQGNPIYGKSLVDSNFQKAVNGLSKTLGFFNNRTEIWVRLAIRRREQVKLTKQFIKDNKRIPTIKEQRRIDVNATAASKIQMDFSRGGTLAKAIDNFIPYFNATLQGFSVSSRYIADNPDVFGYKLVQASGLVIALLLYNLRFKDDYDDVPERDKIGNYIIMLPYKVEKDGEMVRPYYKIPKNQSIQPVMTLVESMAMQYQTGKMSDEMLSMSLESAMPLSNPINMGLDIPIVNAAATYYYNKDRFRNKEVFKNAEITPDILEYYEGQTPQMWRDLATELNMSPERLKESVGKITTDPDNNIYFTLMARSYDAVFGAIPKDKQQSLKEELHKEMLNVLTPFERKFIGYPNSKNNNKVVREIEEQEYGVKKLQDDVVKKFSNRVIKDKENEALVRREFTSWLNSQPKDSVNVDRLKKRFDFSLKLRKSDSIFFDILATQNPKARANIFYLEWFDKSEEGKRELENQLKELKLAPVNKNADFWKEFNRLKASGKNKQ